MTDNDDLIGYTFPTEDGPAVVIGTNQHNPQYVDIQIGAREGTVYSVRMAGQVRRHKEVRLGERGLE